MLPAMGAFVETHTNHRALPPDSQFVTWKPTYSLPSSRGFRKTFLGAFRLFFAPARLVRQLISDGEHQPGSAPGLSPTENGPRLMAHSLVGSAELGGENQQLSGADSLIR